MTWLRYIIDRIAARVEPFCQWDWQDLHDCEKCARIEARNKRLAAYRLRKRLPRARVKVHVP